jgi:hypothetical protein
MACVAFEKSTPLAFSGAKPFPPIPAIEPSILRGKRCSMLYENEKCEYSGRHYAEKKKFADEIYNREKTEGKGEGLTVRD